MIVNQGLLPVIARYTRPLVLLVCMVFVTCVQIRVVTYVCGNDPMLYQRAARVILQPELYGMTALREALTFVAPGYTLLLAMTIRLFGDLAPYWLNFGLLLISLPLMWIVFRALTGSDQAAGLIIMLAMPVLFGGHELSAPFLLYPFREMPVVLCVFAAYALIVTVRDRGGGIIRGAFAGCMMLGACAFREPSIFILPGLLLGVVFLHRPVHQRMRLLAGFAGVWCLALIGVVVAFVALGYAGSDQFEATRYLRNAEVAWSRMQSMLPWVPAQAGWTGSVFLVAGLLRALRKLPVMIFWFFLPAVLLFVFYAFMQMHHRYFLAAFIYLIFFAGYGLDGVLVWIKRTPVSRAWRLKLTRVVGVMIAGWIAYLMFMTVQRAKPWGPHVTASEVKAWKADLEHLTPGRDGRIRVVLDQRYRYLEDLLLSYSDAELLDPKHIDAWPDEWWPAFHFQHLNHQALYATPQWLMHLKIYAHRLLMDRMNLVTWPRDQKTQMMLGDGKYALNYLMPWSPGERTLEVPFSAGEDQAILFDWGFSPSGSMRTIDLMAGEELILSTNSTGQGLELIVVPGEVVVGHSSTLYLRINSTQALPDHPVQSVVRAGQEQRLTLGWDRLMSTHRLFPHLKINNQERHPVTIYHDRWVSYRPPRLLGRDDVSMDHRFIFHTAGAPGYELEVKRAGEEHTTSYPLETIERNGQVVLSTRSPVSLRIRREKQSARNLLLFSVDIAVHSSRFSE